MVADGRSKVLIAGGGIAALEAALALRDLATDRVRVDLLAPHGHFSYEPLSVTAPFARGQSVTFELDELAARVGAMHVEGALTGIDAWRHVAHTSRNVEIEYDILLIACGALATLPLAGATTFRGSADTDRLSAILTALEHGDVRSLAFVIPGGPTWSLPAYELALLTAAHVRERQLTDVELTVVTPESEALQIFGPPATEAIRRLLRDSGITLREAEYAVGFDHGVLQLLPGPALEVDGVVALPRLAGAPLDGIPQTRDGFVPIDAHGRVHGLDNTYAAGDITTFPVKQGGLATQQADAAAEAIAASLGAVLEPRPFRPVLRGLLLTGNGTRYLRREVGGSPEQEPVADLEPLWWPPAKVVGRYLAPFLAELAGTAAPTTAPAPASAAVDIAIELDDDMLARARPQRLPPYAALPDETRIGGLVSGEPIVATADETIGEVAERLVAHATTAAAIVENGVLVGILTAADALRAAAARARPDELPVRLWMTAEPISVPPTCPASAAVLLMSEHRIHHLPVVDGDRVVGMATLEDVLVGMTASPVGSRQGSNI